MPHAERRQILHIQCPPDDKVSLTASEIQAVQTRLVRGVQATACASELDAFQSRPPLPRRCRLLRLNPFKDKEDGTLCVVSPTIADTL